MHMCNEKYYRTSGAFLESIKSEFGHLSEISELAERTTYCTSGTLVICTTLVYSFFL